MLAYTNPDRLDGEEEVKQNLTVIQNLKEIRKRYTTTRLVKVVVV